MGIRIIPTLKKFYIPTDHTINVALAVYELFGFNPNAMLHTSL